MSERTPKERDVQYPENLSVLDRRGRLSDAEQRRLCMALVASEALRCSHQLGRDFDDLQTSSANDEVLVERLVARTRERYARPAAARSALLAHGTLRWLGVAALLLVSAAAGATLWPQAQRLMLSTPRSPSRVTLPTGVSPLPKRDLGAAPVQETNDRSTRSGDEVAPPKPIHAEVAVAMPAARTPNAAVPRSATPGDANEPPAIKVPQAKAAPDDARMGRSSAEATANGEPRESAYALFAAANRARQSGDIERARILYAQLAAAYPNANETALSHVLLARIELQHGGASAALTRFERYLHLAPSGPLAEEATEGKAQAYRLMGMAAEEARVWRELLRRYPNSVYANAARKRLGEL